MTTDTNAEPFPEQIDLLNIINHFFQDIDIFLPLPLAGEGWGEGACNYRQLAPHPNLLPQTGEGTTCSSMLDEMALAISQFNTLLDPVEIEDIAYGNSHQFATYHSESYALDILRKTALAGIDRFPQVRAAALRSRFP